MVGRHEQAILAPYPDMDRAIALTAWGRLQYLDQFDQEAIEQFIKAYIGLTHEQ